MKTIDVVAGVILAEHPIRVLLALRRPEQHQGNRWEFPGGKLEPGESPEQGLVRELTEEIGITVTSSRSRVLIEHGYPDKHVRLHFLDVLNFDGEPLAREGQDLQWFELQALDALEFPEANLPVVTQLQNGIYAG